MMFFYLIASFLFGFLVSYFFFRRRRSFTESSSGEISELARALAHEVRNPLNTIRMNLQLINEELGEHQHQAQRLSRIEGELLRLDRILKSFLDYSKLPIPHFQRVNINQMTHQVVDVLRARSSGMNIEFHPSEEIPCVQADPALLTEALQNILQNAIDASENDGEIVVETARTKDGISIAVTDRGKGIPPEMLDKIFKPYFSTKSGGIGIGMAVVKKIVEAHSGRIRVQSRVGSGTRIVIELPTR